MKTIFAKAEETGALAAAAKILQAGGLVAFPTETVYGLGGNALDAAACAKIYAAKGRPSDNPLISHVADLDMLKTVAAKISEGAQILIKNFWPGPLTIIFPAANGGSVGVRMPANPIARRLIGLAGVPVAAPSANVSGGPSPTLAAHVLADLDGKIDMIIDGGPCEHGLESTVIDCTVTPAVILRPGSVTKEMIEAKIGPVAMATEAGSGPPKAPGMKYKHYAPAARLVVVTGAAANVEREILRLAAAMGDAKFAILAADAAAYEGHSVLEMGRSAAEIGANLFALLRKCDEMGLDAAIVEGVAEEGLGVAIMNRLKKAASYNVVKA